MTASPATPYVRDRFTWLAYLMIAFGTYGITALSPFMPFLAAELGMNYAVRGLHTSAFAIAGIILGLLADRIAHRVPRSTLVWLGSGGLAAASLLIVGGQSPALTIGGAFLMGFFGTLMLVMTQAAMSDHLGAHRSIGINESNLGASVAGLFAPLLISQFAAMALGWRVAILLIPVAWGVLFLWGRRIAIPSQPAAAPSLPVNRTRLPRLYWLFWMMMAIGVMIEWSVSFWSPEFFERELGVDRVTAAGTLTFFWLALITGRLIGSVLSRRFPPTVLLLAAAILVAAAFPVLWLANEPAVGMVALFVMSLGIANFFPMTLAAALGAGSNNINAAAARVALANGIAILIAPQLLGSIADQTGINTAYGMIALLALAMLALGAYALWTQRRRSPELLSA